MVGDDFDEHNVATKGKVRCKESSMTANGGFGIIIRKRAAACDLSFSVKEYLTVLRVTVEKCKAQRQIRNSIEREILKR